MQRNDKLVAAAVNGVLNKKVKDGESFTAYTITQKVRELVGTSIMVDHNDVKSLVHASFLNGDIKGYDRELDHSLTGSPYRYEPVVQAASASAPISNPAVKQVINQSNQFLSNNPILQAAGLATGSVNNNQAPSVPQVTPQAAQAAGTSSVVSRSGNTIRLLKDVLNKAGFRAGEKAYVTYLPTAKQIFVTKNRPSLTSDPLAVTRPYSVDSKQNVRISLSSIGAEKVNNFIAVPVSNQINISCG